MPAVGSHDNMTSTDRVLFSKEDSSDAPPGGEIANRGEQLDNDGAASREPCYRAKEQHNVHDTRGYAPC